MCQNVLSIIATTVSWNVLKFGMFRFWNSTIFIRSNYFLWNVQIGEARITLARRKGHGKGHLQFVNSMSCSPARDRGLFCPWSWRNWKNELLMNRSWFPPLPRRRSCLLGANRLRKLLVIHFSTSFLSSTGPRRFILHIVHI